METPMNWDQEIQDLIDDLLVEALTIELFRLAAGQHASRRHGQAQFIRLFPVGSHCLCTGGIGIVDLAADDQ